MNHGARLFPHTAEDSGLWVPGVAEMPQALGTSL